jgi:hypothetical protein
MAETVIDVSKVWGAQMVAVNCAHCGEAHLIVGIPSRCPSCLHDAIALQPAFLRQEPPEMVLPYCIDQARLAGLFARWTKGIWFRPSGLDPGLLARRARRMLIPLWLVDARVEAIWRADVGFDYQVVSYQDRYREGSGWSSQEVNETRVRWEPRVGRLERAYENVPAPALDDHRALMARLGDYDLAESEAYSPEAVAGAAVRIPSLDPEAAWPGAEAALIRTTRDECRLATGADHIRDYASEAEYNDRNWTLLLLPAYVTWYEEGEHVWPLLVNGQSGRVSGVRRASARKATVTSLVVGAIGGILLLGGGALALAGSLFPPVALLGGIGLVTGLIVALAAPLPIIGVWIANRRSRQ